MMSKHVRLVLSTDKELVLTSNRWSIISVPLSPSNAKSHTVRHFLSVESVDHTPIKAKASGMISLEFVAGRTGSGGMDVELVDIEVDGSSVEAVVDGHPIDTLAFHFVEVLASRRNCIDWIELSSNAAKQSWQVACLYLRPPDSGAEEVIINSRALLRAARITTREDLFCELGESIFGRGGYAGRDLDGMDEVLSEIRAHGRTVSIDIDDVSAFRRAISNFSPPAHFYEDFLDVLRDNGFMSDGIRTQR